MSKLRVLISDPMSSQAINVFEERGIEVVQTGKMTEDELLEIIPEFHGLAIRSVTQVTEKVLAAAKKLKVVGRAALVSTISMTKHVRQGIS